ADRPSSPSECGVPCKGAAGEGGGGGPAIRDAPPCGFPPAAPAVGLVCQERAVVDSKATGTVQDGTTAGCAAAADADRLVLAEQAVAHGERAARKIGNGPAFGGAAGITESLIVRQYVPGQCQAAAGVHDGAAPVAPENPAVADRQPGDRDRHAAADAEDPALVVAAYSQLAGARAVDGQGIGDA